MGRSGYMRAQLTRLKFFFFFFFFFKKKKKKIASGADLISARIDPEVGVCAYLPSGGCAPFVLYNIRVIVARRTRMWLGVWGLASANERVVHAADEQQASDPQVSLSGMRCDFVESGNYRKDPRCMKGVSSTPLA